ncbi:hypothetical protein Kisp01_50400 [Kineosporia sp. NBRC 101677]|uniref:hypothetical protein n=1 Tax=Kineosporia sp. NBRC 101677 TaxID=3032197 RepID=UPI0024A2CEB2|nr:hypothetical protein [Kineosporia sp. NBRC 101677]GLY18026.1 hypothetical protein Kisp01_50400 [Kineosporia sp. NBRC 101677]
MTTEKTPKFQSLHLTFVQRRDGSMVIGVSPDHEDELLEVLEDSGFETSQIAGLTQDILTLSSIAIAASSVAINANTLKEIIVAFLNRNNGSFVTIDLEGVRIEGYSAKAAQDILESKELQELVDRVNRDASIRENLPSDGIDESE